MRNIIIILFSILSISILNAQPDNHITGKVLDASSREPLIGATVYFEGTDIGTTSDRDGNFRIRKTRTNRELKISFLGYESYTYSLDKWNERVNVTILLTPLATSIDDIEVFGERNKQPDKLDYLTRMPLRPNEQIQSISVISEKMIQQQGTMTLADAARNVVGVSTFATYGNASESLSARGYRGIPVLKNGVRVHSDFRGQGMLMDMQGVETIQVIKGSAAVTQGIGDDLGSAGGTVNIATKTPKFANGGEVSLRGGSWGLFRPTFDVQGVVTKSEDVAIRINGAYERSDSYRKGVSKDRFYFNPSLEWRPNDRTSFIFEADILHDSRTPDRGTVNLDASDTYALYKMPNSKFLGFKTDRLFTNQNSYSARFNRKLNDNLSFRVALVSSHLDTDNTGGTTSTLRNVSTTGEYNIRQRSLGRSKRDDNNTVLQIDLVGQDVMTGSIKHTFQAGFDFRRNKLTSTSYGSVVVDTINVLSTWTNDLPSDISLVAGDPSTSREYSYGIMAQDVVTFNKYLKAVLGIRFSYGNSIAESASAAVSGDAFNPMLGLIVTPFGDFNIFGSYTNTSSLRSASNLMENGKPIGASVTDQFEAGIKSEWFDHRLRFNVTLYHVNNKNLAYQIYDDADQATNRYSKAGDLRRRGVEVESSGRLLPNLQVILGYAYLDAQYRNSPAYVEGSAPMNAPKHTANGWVYYTLDRSALQGLSIGLGAYYVGERPVNDYTMKTTHANSDPGVKPFNLKAYTTINATLAYDRSRYGISLVFNNIFNSLGYSSYFRGGFINPTDPFNLSASVRYRF